MHYLYRITNKINGKYYIGQTNNLHTRWIAHKNCSESPTQVIHHALAKYGINNFEFDHIATCKTIDQANDSETELIKQYDSLISNNGYNLTTGGKNFKFSEETKEKMRNRMLEYLKTNLHPSKGKPQSEERRKQNSVTINKLYDERFKDRKCVVEECEAHGNVAYRVIDGVRYCRLHGLRMLRNGDLEKRPAFKYTEDNPMPDYVRIKRGNGQRGKVAWNRKIFKDEEIQYILNCGKSIKALSREFKVTEKVIKRVRDGRY